MTDIWWRDVMETGPRWQRIDPDWLRTSSSRLWAELDNWKLISFDDNMYYWHDIVWGPVYMSTPTSYVDLIKHCLEASLCPVFRGNLKLSGSCGWPTADTQMKWDEDWDLLWSASWWWWGINFVLLGVIDRPSFLTLLLKKWRILQIRRFNYIWFGQCFGTLYYETSQ